MTLLESIYSDSKYSDRNIPKKILKCVREYKAILIEIDCVNFSSKELNYFFKYLYYIKKLNLKKFDIRIKIQVNDFKDKVVYLLFEKIIYDILCNEDYSLYIGLNWEKLKNGSSLIVAGFMKTTLFETLIKCNGSFFDKQLFLSEYCKSIDYAGVNNSYKLKRYYNKLKDTKSAKITVTNFYTSLENAGIKDRDFLKELSEVLLELFCNVHSHSDGEVLVDIDIFLSDDKKQTNINIAFINISSLTIYDKTLHLFKNGNIPDFHMYKVVNDSYTKQRENGEFIAPYSEEHFFMFANFQKNISTRENMHYDNIGTGLATLIGNIQNRTEVNSSYVLSGNKALFFDNNIINIDDDLLTMNESKNINERLSKKVVDLSNVYIPGAIYNLNLFYKEN